MGLPFLLQTQYLLPLTGAALLLALGALGVRAARRLGYGPFVLGLAAAIFVVVGKFAWELDAMWYAGIALLIVASVWNAWPKRASRHDLIEPGTPKGDS